MPRANRPSGLGLRLHIIFNALEGEVLFRSDEDKFSFIADFRKVREQSDVVCTSAAILDTHGHLSLEGGAVVPVSEFLRRVLTRYCVKFNIRYERRGHVLRNRHHAIVMDDRHALNAFRYIILNPLKAGMVSSLERLEHYPFSILPELLGHQPARFGSIPETLSTFGSTVDEARERIRGWLRESVHNTKLVRTIENTFRRRKGFSSLLTERIDFELEFSLIISRVCAAAGISESAVLSGRRSSPAAARCRAAIAYLATTNLALDVKRVAQRLGIGSSSTATLRKVGEVAARALGLIDADLVIPQPFLDGMARRRLSAVSPPAQASELDAPLRKSGSTRQTRAI